MGNKMTSLTWLFFIGSALLEVGGDAVVRRGSGVLPVGELRSASEQRQVGFLP